MTLLINQVLFSFEMRKYGSFVEMNVLKTITKALRRIWALDRDRSQFGTCRTISTTLTTLIIGKKTFICWKEPLKNLLICSVLL